jgi:cytochrome bd ubiquinol oxidase subunit II
VNASWFAIIALMLTAYTVLDGFDFGAGIVHRFVARTDAERRTVLAAIGPLWDGNEVWLLASGGVLVFAFPRVYAAAFSGLYLALMIVLWLLILRGISIEFRSKVNQPLWREAWDTVFAVSSAAMAVVLGVAIGNVVRGVPIDATGSFHEDLFGGTGLRHPGAIDLYTSVFGLVGLASFGAHGATFLTWKTSGELSTRSAVAARRLWVAALVLLALATVLTAIHVPAFRGCVLNRPWLWPLPIGAVAAALVARASVSTARTLRAFLASCAFLGAMLLATAVALFPVLLRSTIAEDFNLDAYNAASERASLVVGLWVWAPAIALAIGYFVYLFRSLRGKTDGTGHHY